MEKIISPLHSSCTDPVEQGFIRVDHALQHILKAVRPVTGYETVPLAKAINRVLYENIVSTVSVPAHRNSAVDGFAVRSIDFPDTGQTVDLPVRDTVLAGAPSCHDLNRPAAIRIMTGATIPDGADTVLMQEHVEQTGTSIRVNANHKPGENIRQAGEDLQKGETILKAGQLCTPADIGLIASLGIGEVKVKRQLRLAIFSTGDEIQSIGGPLRKGAVYDSNRYTLNAALKAFPVATTDLGIVPDNKPLLLGKFTEAAAQADVIITTGGVSVGQADYTREMLQAIGSVEFWKVAIKPGRPFAFGKIDTAAFFGLPGNPVAVLVTFYQFVRPALHKIMGLSEPPLALTLKARSLEPIRKKPGRTEMPRGILSQTEDGLWNVRTTGKQGSGILRSMSLANAFIVLPHDSDTVEPGDEVLVQPFSSLI